MSEDATPFSRDVVLGFDAAWGFAPVDQTSPALAGAAGALVDTTLEKQPVTELRIHGVSGSDGPTMLEHPGVLQVAGDTVTGFYRRWSPDGQGRPSIPWKLEAYSWGGLTEAPLASASWLLLAPLMMYNVAYFMLPPEATAGDPAAVADQPVPHLDRGKGHRIAGMLLRLLALAATVQFVSAAALVAVSTVAWQAAGRKGMLPRWMGWYGDWTAGWRVALALAAVAVVVAALWWVSVTTGRKYEGRTSTASNELNAIWPLTQPGFWKGETLVGRQRKLHVAAACAVAALIASLPAGRPATARWVAVILAAMVLAAAAVSIISPMASRHEVTLAQGGRPRGGGADAWCWGVMGAALAALVTAAVVSGWTDRRHGPQTGALPGLTGLLAVLLAVQAALLIMLTVIVVVLARRTRAGGGYREVPPYLCGGLAALIAWLGFLLGGLLSAVIAIGVTRLLGTPVPSGFRFAIPPSDALAVPWPIYAFGAAPAGLLCGAIVAAILILRGYWRNCAALQGAPAGGNRSEVAVAYAASTAGPDGSTGDDKAYTRNRGAIAKAWALALVSDEAPVALALAAGGSMVVVLAAELAAAVAAGSAGHPVLLPGWCHGLATLIAVVGVLAAGWLVALLRLAYSNTSKRKTIGALWDVATFWPRAVHPLAPPCYAERAVPEVVDRIRLLTGHIGSEPDDVANLHAQAGRPNLERTSGLTVPPGPMLLTGYSQGSVIAPAVIAQLPPDVRREVALLTLACPARRLYGRAFPAYFGSRQLATLADLLDANTTSGQPRGDGQPAGRWKNLRRRSDYIGSWIFTEPAPRLSNADLESNVDQPCWDPVILVPDANPTPPPTHRHSQWWQDPRTSVLGTYLVKLLAAQASDKPRSASAAKPAPSPPAALSATDDAKAEPSPHAGPAARAVTDDAESGPSLIAYAINTLLAVGRWRRKRAHHDSVEFANAGPPSALSPGMIRLCIPAEPPPDSETLAERARYRSAEQPEQLEQAWLWTLALDAVVRTEIQPRIKSVQALTYGFVESQSAVQLAAIFYVRIPALAQRAPLFAEVGSRKFPVVIRPPYKDVNAHADVRFIDGQVACGARLGSDYGVLTAAHVVGRGDKFSVVQHDRVACSRTGSSSSCEHRILAIDPIMDAALVEADIAAGDVEVVRAMDIVGYFPVSIDSPNGLVTSVIVETEVPQGIIPGTPGTSPADPALLWSLKAGDPGWSGSLVSENLTGRPYCIFLGAREFYHGKLGRLQMLRQIEIVWGAEMLRRPTE